MVQKREVVVYCADAEAAEDWVYALHINSGRRWLRCVGRAVSDEAQLAAELGENVDAVLLVVETAAQGEALAARLKWHGRAVVAVGLTPAQKLKRRLTGQTVNTPAVRKGSGPVFALAWQSIDVVECLASSLVRRRGPKPGMVAKPVCTAPALSHGIAAA